MSKGSPIVCIRLSPLELAALDAAIELSNKHRSAAPWTRTSYVITAIREKLAHAERSRRPKKARARKDLHP